MQVFIHGNSLGCVRTTHGVEHRSIILEDVFSEPDGKGNHWLTFEVFYVQGRDFELREEEVYLPPENPFKGFEIVLPKL